MKQRLNEIMEFAKRASATYDEVHKLTAFYGTADKYIAKAVIDGKEYIVERTQKDLDELNLDDFKDIQPGMVKEIIHQWHEATNQSLDPPVEKSCAKIRK